VRARVRTNGDLGDRDVKNAGRMPSSQRQAGASGARCWLL